ncbi:MAG: hypothetical protein HYU66_10970 [Armatimonadetes bacterium]|nr:hypothetical protein [Armatimonadota bacterium]
MDRTYQDGRIHKLAGQLEGAGVAPEVAGEILAGGEAVVKATPPAAKAAWFRGAMERMDALLDEATRHRVRERCACCLGGKRLEISRGIAREHASLEERLQAANEAKFVFGHAVSRQDNGRILVEFAPAGLERYDCVCLRQAGEPISATYCYCCGGHAKHHLQIALGRKLECTVRSSALSSGGREACTFVFGMVD